MDEGVKKAIIIFTIVGSVILAIHPYLNNFFRLLLSVILVARIITLAVGVIAYGIYRWIKR